MVISADWMMEWSHSFSKDLQWINKSQLIVCDVPELQKIVIVLGGATCAMQQTMNVQWSYRTTMVQTGTKVKLLQHCLVRL